MNDFLAHFVDANIQLTDKTVFTDLGFKNYTKVIY